MVGFPGFREAPVESTCGTASEARSGFTIASETASASWIHGELSGSTAVVIPIVFRTNCRNPLSVGPAISPSLLAAALGSLHRGVVADAEALLDRPLAVLGLLELLELHVDLLGRLLQHAGLGELVGDGR